MRLCRFEADGGSRPGRIEGDAVVDRETGEQHGIDDVRLLAPVQPRKFLGIGLNYADHIAESGMEAPEFPIFFNKQPSCVVGPGADVHLPRVSSLLDYEGELAVVIGNRCRHVPEERAHEVIAGYTVANDLSVRDWQLRTPTMTLGKSFDTHGPLGPWIVTPDELGDPHALTIRTWVNDELRQDASTSRMIYDCFQQVAHLSQAFTLEPGDVIALYSDGISEAQSVDEEEYCVDRLVDSLRRHLGRGADAVLQGVIDDLDAFVGDAPQYDDITLVVLKRLPAA